MWDCANTYSLVFIGNHTDYNCVTVLGASIDRSIFVAAGPRDDGRMVLASDFGAVASVCVTDNLVPLVCEGAWANYPLGVLQALEKRGFRRPAGLNFAVASDVQLGAGLSSSAALELASGMVFCGLAGISLPLLDLVHAVREAENEFVEGAGIGGAHPAEPSGGETGGDDGEDGKGDSQNRAHGDACHKHRANRQAEGRGKCLPGGKGPNLPGAGGDG